MDNVVSIVATVYAEAVFVIIPPPIGECKPRESKIALKLLLSLFLEDGQDGESLYQRYGESQATFSTVNTGLEEYGITCPPVDEKLIIKYLDFLESQGYLTSGGKQEKI